MLKNLVQESINDPDIIQAGPQLTHAVGELARALHLAEGQPSHSSAKTNQGVYTTTPTAGPEDGTARRPRLPEISDSALEMSVFTHPALAQANDAAYDRLEVLGDAYIELMATKLVWDRFPRVPAGRMSQIRELLVKNETLARFAEDYGFDRRVSVPANYSDQAKRWTKTKGDVFEAYVAAVILSHPIRGYQVAENWLRALWSPLLDNLGHQKVELKAKEELARKVMVRGVRLEYLEEMPSIQEKGSGTQTFFIGVYLTGWGWEKRHLGSGKGPSKVSAGDDAAHHALLKTHIISDLNAKKVAHGGK